MKNTINLLKVGRKVYVNACGHQPLQFVLLNIFTVLLGVMPTVIIYITGLFISSIIGAVEINQMTTGPFLYALLIFSVILLQVLISILNSKISLNVSFANQHYHQSMMIESIKKTHTQNFENKSFLDGFQIAGKGIEHVNSITTIIPQIISSLISCISLLIYISNVSVLFGLIFFFTTIPIFLFDAKYGTKRWKLDQSLVKDNRKMQYCESVLTTEAYGEEVRLFNTQAYFLDRWKQTYDKIFTEKRKLGRKKLFAGFLGQINTPLTLFLLLLYLINLIFEGSMKISDINVYIMSAQVFASAVFNLFGIFTSAYQSTLYLNDMYHFIDDVEQGKYWIGQKNLIYKESACFENGNIIQVNHLSFQYPDQTSRALRDISFSIKEGETIAIVGKNGSGKTTLSKLLLGILVATDGEILVDKSCNKLAYVMQDFMHYNFSAKENIILGDVKRPNDNIEIQKSARNTGAEQFIQTLPNYYDTILGKGFQESGTDLSGGNGKS